MTHKHLADSAVLYSHPVMFKEEEKRRLEEKVPKIREKC